MRSESKRIAKNTIYLYLRSVITIVLSLYSSRVILHTLGVDNFGVYQVVGGVVGVLAFFTTSLNSAGTRFLTFALGKGDESLLKKTFNTLVTVHFALVMLIVVLAETVGLWFVSTKAGIDASVLPEAIYAYHFSVLTAALAFLQVPFVSLIIAREEMNYYAVLGVMWPLGKLVAAFVIGAFAQGRLPMYAGLLLASQGIISVMALVYTYLRFPESRFKFVYDGKLLKQVAGYTGWTTTSSVANVLNIQGLNIITNIFFNPATVVARAISIQVRAAVETLYRSFRSAIKPQIIKRYAAGDEDGSKWLLLVSTRYSFYLIFLTCFPVIVVARKILELWLGIVPNYAVIFLQLIMVETMVSIFDACFTTPLEAKGQIKENAIISPLVLFLKFPIVYLLFLNGSSPVALSYAGIVGYLLMSWVIKPILLMRICGYHIRDFIQLVLKCVWVIMTPILVAIKLLLVIGNDTIWDCLLICVVILAVTMLSVYLLGLEKAHRGLVNEYIRKFVKKTR